MSGGVERLRKQLEEIMKKVLSEEFKELKSDIAWARKTLRRARKHFWKGYIFLITGSILAGIERIIPVEPVRRVVALASVVCLAASALTYWYIMRG